MSRINTNVNSLIAQRILKQNNEEMNLSLRRLSTGLKINNGADNPAGLIASENLRAEKTGLQVAMSNAERAGNIIATAEGGLSEISNLLNEVQALVNETANSGGLSAEEIEANQLQVDAILNTINRLAQSTNFQGMKLLNGNYGYTTSNVANTDLENVRINSARLPDNSSQNVTVQVTNSATTAQLTFSGTTFAEGFTVEVAGRSGTEQLSFLSSATQADIATAINAVTTATGVSAVASGGTLFLNSTDYGSRSFVSVSTVAGTFMNDQANGDNAVVAVNGAQADTDGLKVKYRSSNLDVEFDLTATLNAGNNTEFQITGGGATFALGSKVTENDKASIGISSVTTGTLGFEGGFLSSLASGSGNSLTSGNLVETQRIVDSSLKQVSQLRGRLGAFQKFVINSTINQLGVAFENASSAESAIRDADFAVETAALTRTQILAQASTNVLAQANARPQMALQLLG